ncbi:MAG TPA: ABC transporter permease [Sporichthya sp.]|nr:ABC transporter permease [Sporichthya sp.]
MSTAALAPVARSEWTKLRSLRSTWWTLAAYLTISIGFCALVTWLFAGRWGSVGEENRQAVADDPIGLILQPGAQFGQLAVAVLGVFVFAGEYSSGSIRSSILAVPRRRHLLIAKAAVLAAVVFAIAEAVAFGSYALASPFVGKHADLAITDPTVLRALVGTGIYLALIGLFALAIGAMVRHVGGAIAAVLALILVVPGVLGSLPGHVGLYLSDYAPGGMVGQRVMSTGTGEDWAVGPIGALAITAGWTLLALALAAGALSRRDV